MKNAIIQQLEQEQMKKDIPAFRPGDTVEVKVWVVEGNKKRLQAYEGVVRSEERRVGKEGKCGWAPGSEKEEGW